MAQCDTQALLDASSCYQCIDPQTLEYVKVAVLCEIWQESNPMAICDVQTLLDSAKCFQCVDPGFLAALQTQLLCEILQAGGGGLVCNFCEEYDPNVNPPDGCTCGHWTNTLTAEMWYWRPLTSTWVKYITNT